MHTEQVFLRADAAVCARPRSALDSTGPDANEVTVERLARAVHTARCEPDFWLSEGHACDGLTARAVAMVRATRHI